jgi:proteasome lid subunit RPN8/RPN11
MLTLEPNAAAAIRAHAEEGYPLEICGFLVGHVRFDDAEDRREAVEAWPVRNTWEDDPQARAALLASFDRTDSERTTDAGAWDEHGAERRFLIAPKDVLAAMKRAVAAGMDLIGVYHTHPEHPAVPSEFDREAASPGWSYVILSVRNGEVAEFRSWVLSEDDERFHEETIGPLASSS